MWSRVFLLFLCPRVAPALLHLYRRCKFSHFRNWNWKKLVNVISELTRNNWNYFRESVRFRMIDFTGYFLLTADPSGNCCVFMFMFLLRVPWGGAASRKLLFTGIHENNSKYPPCQFVSVYRNISVLEEEGACWTCWMLGSEAASCAAHVTYQIPGLFTIMCCVVISQSEASISGNWPMRGLSKYFQNTMMVRQGLTSVGWPCLLIYLGLSFN